MSKEKESTEHKKLYLYLDIDNTILEAQDVYKRNKKPTVVPILPSLEERFKWLGEQEILYISCDSQDRAHFSITLRPGILDYLLATRDMVQITVTTTGTTDYGQAVINLLDPKHELFKILVGRER